MKKRNLTTAFLTFALCAIAVTGAGCAPQGLSVDEAEAVAVTSTAETEPVEMADDSAIVDGADAKPAQEAEAAPVEAEPIAPEGKEGETTPDPKPTVQAAYQPQVKKTVQSSAVAPKQQPQAKPAAASLEAEPSGGEVNDEVLMVIDTVPAVAEAIDAEQPAAKARTITVNGVAIDYVDSFRTSSAPEQDAGLWLGSDSTTDGSFGYFIGHNNTEFGDVANLEQGNVVSVTDSNGDSCDYEVVDSFVVPEGTLWSEVSDRVTGYGESIVMQTCVDDGYMIVVAD